MHYTFVLTPDAEEAQKFVEASRSLFERDGPEYLLNDWGTSSPHITLVQFDCDSQEEAQRVWEHFCSELDKIAFQSFIPNLIGIAFIEGTGVYEGTTWVELSVSRGDEKGPLLTLHTLACNTLHSFGITPLNAIGSTFRPHLTLARLRMNNSYPLCSNKLFQNKKNFTVRFGVSDEKWQFAETIDTYPAP